MSAHARSGHSRGCSFDVVKRLALHRERNDGLGREPQASLQAIPEGGPSIRLKRPPRHVSVANREPQLAVASPNELWSMAFASKPIEMGGDTEPVVLGAYPARLLLSP